MYFSIYILYVIFTLFVVLVGSDGTITVWSRRLLTVGIIILSEASTTSYSSLHSELYFTELCAQSYLNLTRAGATPVMLILVTSFSLDSQYYVCLTVFPNNFLYYSKCDKSELQLFLRRDLDNPTNLDSYP